MKEKPSSGTKQFLLTLLATTFSIILTFGTSAIIDRRHKAAAKKEMVMMIIYDFDKTIEQAQEAESAIHQAKSLLISRRSTPSAMSILSTRSLLSTVCAINMKKTYWLDIKKR